MNENDRPPSPQHAASAQEDERSESSFVRSIGNWLRGLGRGGETTWRESVEEIIEEEEEVADQISAEERGLLMNLLRFGKLRVEDAMVPRGDIVAVEENASLEDVVSAIKSESHSRMPVYRETLDDVIGMVHMRDVMTFWGDTRPFRLSDVMRKILFVPQSMPVVDLLAQMRHSRQHMAVIVDEYGGTDGMVTIEDLVEEIVGEIEDEHDQVEAPALVAFSDGTFEADARTRVEELERRVGRSLLADEDEEDIDTLGGLVFALAGRVPRRGEVIVHPAGLRFEILDADPRRIKRLKIRSVDPMSGSDQA